MTTLEELIYYCKEPEPVGALMLTGEWGCGKTYLLEHGLKEELKQTHIVLRISLFGISSVESICEGVNSAWMNAYLEDRGWSKKSDTLIRLKDRLSRLPLPGNWKNVVSFNPANLFNVESKLNGKKVILVFDDLERSKLDTIDVLGCINDYCENQGFYTIIVANEDKILDRKNEKSELSMSKADVSNTENQTKMVVMLPHQQDSTTLISYKEIKEKIIERTIKYKPDYNSIIHAVIKDQVHLSDEYYDFIRQNEQDILRFFASPVDEYFVGGVDNIFKEIEEATSPSHNIRSLKCALQDFYRIYRVLIEHGFSDLEKWLYSFMSYMFAYKSGIAKEGAYGTLFTDEEVRKEYPSFDNRFIFKTAKNWILKGEWNERLLASEIASIKEREAAVIPKDVVRTNSILDIEEDVLIDGFPAVLDMAYHGQLSLDEYIIFISNAHWSREYLLDIADAINWKNVKHGIQICIDKLVNENAEDTCVGMFIDNKDKEKFTNEEWGCYELIERFRSENVLIFNVNRNLYLSSLREDPVYAFLKCERKRMNVFDIEMAEATAEAFMKCANIEKKRFSNDFQGMWQYYESRPGMKIDDTIQGLKKLLNLLLEGKESLQKQNKRIAVGHTDRFIKVVEQLIPR